MSPLREDPDTAFPYFRDENGWTRAGQPPKLPNASYLVLFAHGAVPCIPDDFIQSHPAMQHVSALFAITKAIKFSQFETSIVPKGQNVFRSVLF
jgi:hypothetical protein